jgi:hypothetical protein
MRKRCAVLVLPLLLLGCGSGSSGGPATHTGLFEFGKAVGEPLARDSGYLYWVGARGIVRAPLAGGATTTIAGGGVFNCYGLAVDGQAAYWTNFDDHTVSKVAASGGTPVVLATNQDQDYAIVKGGASVFWEVNPSAAQASLMTVPKSGGATQTFATSPTQYFGALAADDSAVYYALAESSTIESVPLAGGAPSKVAGFDAGPVTRMVVDGGTLYFTSFEGNAIGSVPVSGGTPTTLAKDLPAPRHLAVDGGFVYFTAQGPHGVSNQASILRVPVAGGTPETLASGRPSNGLGDIAVGPTYVYWIEQAGNLMATTK